MEHATVIARLYQINVNQWVQMTILVAICFMLANLSKQITELTKAILRRP